MTRRYRITFTVQAITLDSRFFKCSHQTKNGRTEVTTRWTKTVANNVNTQEKILTSTVWNKTNQKGWKTENQRNTHIDKNLQENSTQYHCANTPGGDTRKLTQLSIINKESRNIPTPTVMWQRHPTIEHPVNISALKRKEFYAFSGFRLKHSLQITITLQL